MKDSQSATERVGRYQILDTIGGGPNGTVSRAKVFGVAGFERQFAVKRFLPELTVLSAHAQALSAAARAYGGLEHPRIARMTEFGVAQGQTFTAVEYVVGLDAMRLLAETKMSGIALAIGGALALISQAARAVGYAHGRGLTHLGLAPTNVIVTVEGDVKVTDFGILAATLPPRPLETARLANRIPYLAPEQLAGEATSAASDVFVLGVIAYELVTGQRAFRGETPQEVANGILGGPPPEPPLPRPIVRVLQRCLARSPFERFPDARALADALDAALRVAPVPGTRKDIGAQVKQIVDRLGELNEGNMSGMLALDVSTAPRPALAPQVSPPARPSQHDSLEVATNPFVRPDVPVAGPTPLVGPAQLASAAQPPGATFPDLPKPMTTVPGIPPPPIPVPPGIATGPVPPPTPTGEKTIMGLVAAKRPMVPPVIPPVKPPQRPGDGPPERPSSPRPVRIEPRSAEARAAEARNAEARNAEARNAEARNAEPRSVEPPPTPPTRPTPPLVPTQPSQPIEIAPFDSLFNVDVGKSSPLAPLAPPAPPTVEPVDAIDPNATQVPTQEFEKREVPTGEMSPLQLDELNKLAIVAADVSATSAELAASGPHPGTAEPARAPTPPPGPPGPPMMTPPPMPTPGPSPFGPPPGPQHAMPPPPLHLPSSQSRLSTMTTAKRATAVWIALAVVVVGGGGLAAWLALRPGGSSTPTKVAKGSGAGSSGSAVVVMSHGSGSAVSVPPVDAAVVAKVEDAVAKVEDATAKPAAIDAGVTAPVASSDALQIASTPPGAHVFLDGADQGVTPLKLAGSADRHNVALLLAGHDLYVAEVEGHGQFNIELKPVTPSAGPAGIKVIKCKDKDRYYVFVDAKPTGMMCPTERINVEVGPHTVEVYDAVSESRQKWDIRVADTRLSYRVRIDSQ